MALSNIRFFISDTLTLLANITDNRTRAFYMRVYKKYDAAFGLLYTKTLNLFSNKQAIDILIPVIPKDLPMLPHVVAGARKNIIQPINRIYIVAPDLPQIREAAKALNCIFINEADVLGFKKNYINYTVNGIDRSGWLFQQLIKLSVDKISESENILILDSDTVFTSKKTFLSLGNLILDFVDEYHTPYYKTYEKLTGLKHTEPVSYVAHYMLFNRRVLVGLRELIEQLHNKTWYDAIIDSADSNELSCFSEYETYSNYYMQLHPKRFFKRYWFNIKIKPQPDALNESELAKYGKFFTSLSMHNTK